MECYIDCLHFSQSLLSNGCTELTTGGGELAVLNTLRLSFTDDEPSVSWWSAPKIAGITAGVVVGVGVAIVVGVKVCKDKDAVRPFN